MANPLGLVLDTGAVPGGRFPTPPRKTIPAYQMKPRRAIRGFPESTKTRPRYVRCRNRPIVRRETRQSSFPTGRRIPFCGLAEPYRQYPAYQRLPWYRGATQYARGYGRRAQYPARQTHRGPAGRQYPSIQA